MLKNYPLSIKLLVGFALVMLIAEFHRIGDFNIFLLASKSMAEGHNMYVMYFVHGYKYFYSPLFAILIYPLTLIPLELAGFIWNLLSFVMLGRLFWVIQKLYFNHIKFPQNKIFILAFLALIYPLYLNFHQTQMSVFVLFSIFECLYRIQNKQFLLAAFWLAIAINIKIMPLVFIPYLIYRREYKVVLYVILFSVLFLVIPMLSVGYSNNIVLHREWFKLLNPLKPKNVIDLHERQLHGLTSLIASLFTDVINISEKPIRRHIVLLEHQTVSYIINTVRGFLVLFTFYFLRTKPFVIKRNKLSCFWEISYITLLIPLIFPHQQSYAFVLMLPSVIYLVYFFNNGGLKAVKPKWHKVMLRCFIVAAIIVNLTLLLGEFRELYWHFKTMTYGALIILVLLALCQPKYIKEN